MQRYSNMTYNFWTNILAVQSNMQFPVNFQRQSTTKASRLRLLALPLKFSGGGGGGRAWTIVVN